LDLIYPAGQSEAERIVAKLRTEVADLQIQHRAEVYDAQVQETHRGNLVAAHTAALAEVARLKEEVAELKEARESDEHDEAVIGGVIAEKLVAAITERNALRRAYEETGDAQAFLEALDREKALTASNTALAARCAALEAACVRKDEHLIRAEHELSDFTSDLTDAELVSLREEVGTR